jgi:hypothetical protein
MLYYSITQPKELQISEVVLRVVGSPTTNLEGCSTQSVPNMIDGRQEPEPGLEFATPPTCGFVVPFADEIPTQFLAGVGI